MPARPVPRRLALIGLAAAAASGLGACKPSASASAPAASKPPVKLTEFHATLFFDTAPNFSTQQLMDAFAREGYECEPASPGDHWHGVLRGRSAVFLGAPKPADHSQHPDDYPALTQTGIDYDATYLINPLAAWQDFQAARHEVPLHFKIVQEEGDDMAFWQCELITALLGIHQVQPLRALWLDHLGLFIGQADLAEYLAYRDTTGGAAPSQPDPLMFGTLTLRHESGAWQAWTTGLELFGHPNLHISAPGLSALDSLRPLFNTGRMVLANAHKGWRLQAGETLSTGDFSARIAAAPFRGEDMLQLIPL